MFMSLHFQGHAALRLQIVCMDAQVLALGVRVSGPGLILQFLKLSFSEFEALRPPAASLYHGTTLNQGGPRAPAMKGCISDCTHKCS